MMNGGKFMEKDSLKHKDGIKSQLEDAYGKMVYSYTTHNKEVHLLKRKINLFKILNIVLSAVATCGLISVIFEWNTRIIAILTAIITTTTLVISTYLKSSNIEESIIKNKQTADKLWKIKQDFESVFTDFETKTEEQLQEDRNRLFSRLEDVYTNSPITDGKAYKMAQNALKNEEEQFFSQDELNKIKPKHLRNSK